jgi:hypothetical protein
LAASIANETMRHGVVIFQQRGASTENDMSPPESSIGWSQHWLVKDMSKDHCHQSTELTNLSKLC